MTIALGRNLFQCCAMSNNNKLTPKELKANEVRIKQVLKKTFNKLADKAHVTKIVIKGNKVTYYSSNSHQSTFIIDKKISARGISAVFERDIVGEKIKAVVEPQSTLYLFSSGGGGHKSAKDAAMERNLIELMDQVKADMDHGTLNIEVEMDLAKAEELGDDERLTDPIKFGQWLKHMGLATEADVLHDYLGKFGKWATHQWDEAQKVGDVEKQEKLAKHQCLSDFILGPVVFFKTLIMLIIKKPKQVVSTQAMATPAILQAINCYNLLFRPKGTGLVKLHLYMTDMPTEYARHFFNSLKKLINSDGKKLLVLHAPKLEGEKNWKELCGLEKEQVKELDVTELPVRLDFLKAVKTYKPPDAPRVEMKVGEQEELQLLQGVVKHQSGQEAHLGNVETKGVQVLDYQLKAGDKGYFIMLGSQPTKSAIEGYLQEFVKLAKANPKINYHVFAFAGKFDKDKECFYKELSKYLLEQKEWPKNLRFLPLSFQTPKQLVSLEMSCDTITRSGGSTAMELLVLDGVEDVPKRKRFVHAQQVEGRTLTESIPLWERGNYFFLEKHVGATVIDPDSLAEAINKE